ncbi:acetyl-CoA carboxylase biotin carboxyl carrier protein [Urechidicola croceus]|uniref:Biotin carboxyl carrier protein of acetyl-CoA carboxylase n=1 Tax=Urechidicola croceus TaxID=1850246 RepID=A0A1D8PAA5_9FLAO|nr:acetyl-CoA carboxylase biotin carboxyl carrier protein [Urechidicola croceus]AOW21446.1 acetyl-CoA carboxylase, biotin carboxyl carrier protein [Urechidicola croceus]
MDLKEIQSLIKFVSKSGVNEVKLEVEDFKITIKTGAGVPETTIVHQAAPVGIPQTPVAVTPSVDAVPTEVKVEDEESKYVTITSPIIGTFYRKPSPDKPNFVEVGDTIQADSVVCIVEAMKLFNEIEAEVSGKIVKVLVDEASPVEFGQPLYLVDPS